MTLIVSKRYDCRGKDVFVPILHLCKKLQEMRVGEILELLSDDPAAEPDLRAWSKLTGHKLVEIYFREDFNRFYIQKKF